MEKSEKKRRIPASIAGPFTPENPIRMSIGAFELTFRTTSKPVYHRVKLVFREEDEIYQRTGTYHMGKILSALFSEDLDVDLAFRYPHMKTHELRDSIYYGEFLPFVEKVEALTAERKEKAV